jgi:predicted metal-dependent hydrolase
VEAEVEVRRSARRRRTVSAYRDGERTVVLIPARMSKAEEAHWVATMLARLARSDARSAARRGAGDDALRRRALALSRRHLDGRATPASVRWVTNQRSRWGSCTPAERTIRLSHALREMPEWVVDYVLVHELAHLLVADHSAAFWDLVGRYPMAERARGYLLGVAASHPGLAADPDDDLAGEETPVTPVTPLAPRRRPAPAPDLGGLQLELG